LTYNYSGLCKEIHKKVPSITSMPRTNLDLFKCNFKGDTTNDAFTTGVLVLQSDAIIKQCSFAHHKSGAIMMDLEPQNRVVITENNIVSCETTGIYV
jgi:hypothetical protein